MTSDATEQPARHHHHRFEGRGEGQRRGGFGGVDLFVSPAGEPFRSGPDGLHGVDRWFEGADADRDGRLSRAEFRADAARYFRALDRNGDGVIDGGEVAAYEHEVLPELLASTGPRGTEAGERPSGGWSGGGRGRGHRHGGGAGGGSAPRAALEGAALYTLNRQSEPVTSADANFDGKVTLAEFLAAADRHYAELDAAGAGYLTREALPKTVAEARSQRSRPDRD